MVIIMPKKSIGEHALSALTGTTNARKSSKGSMDLVQQFGVNANNEKSIGAAFYFMCTSLTWYLICKIRGDSYTAISSVTDVEDIATQDALKKILEIVVKPTLNQYSLDNGMPTKESKAGNIYPLMNQGLAKPIFRCIGKDYMTKGKSPSHVFEAPKGNLPGELAVMLADSIADNCDGLELDAADL